MQNETFLIYSAVSGKLIIVFELCYRITMTTHERSVVSIPENSTDCSTSVCDNISYYWLALCEGNVSRRQIPRTKGQ